MPHQDCARAISSAPTLYRPVRKTPNDRLCRLQVEAEICPNVLLRVLDLVSRHALVPLTITSERRDDHLWLEVAVDGLPERAAQILLGNVEAMVKVRDARLVLPG